MTNSKNNQSFIEAAIQNKADEETMMIREEDMFGIPRIVIVGCGGAGGNTITRLQKLGVKGADTIAINTDKQALDLVEADHKLLIGAALTHGLGAGSLPQIGEEAAKESEQDIRNAVGRSDMVFVTCGLGGGTGTGSSPVIAETSKKLGAITIAIVTLPFSMEGQQRMKNAKDGLENLRKVVDTIIVVPNDKLLEIVPDVSLATAFKVADEILVNSVK